ncbi:MAG: amidophosphoribosyltransferase [Burkholderiales bacterium]|nr:amidophosphoribosyltransferase [Burkholderiales bacterium]
MCGIVGVVSQSPVNQLIYDALLLLQHRGQDAAGIATNHGNMFAMHKANGLVRDVFRTRNMRSLAGNSGIGHVRYPTAGSPSEEEAQPFYVNAPFGITLAHNGNLTNWEQLKREMFKIDRRHINTDSDSEVLLNVLAHEIQEATTGYSLDPAALFKAVAILHQRVKGAYAAVAQIAGLGLLAFRDPLGIRPLCLGINETDTTIEYMVASESVALEGSGFRFLRDILPGEAVFISLEGKLYQQQCAENASLNPCAFEYVYLARPDSVLDGASVYATRLKMGEFLAERVRKELSSGDIDVVMPIPDSSRPAAMQLAQMLNLDYREGLIKNRYIGRTFLMPGQAIRRKSVRQKLNTIGELIAYGRSDAEIAAEITADALVYQDIESLKAAITVVNPAITRFDTSCFDGTYVTGDVTREYLDKLENARNQPRKVEEDAARSQLNLNLAPREQ